MKIVGEYFSCYGHIYYCDSEDKNGFWMTPIKENAWAPTPATRTNISSRAINTTFHMIMTRPSPFDGMYTTNYRQIQPDEEQIIRVHMDTKTKKDDDNG